MRRLGLFLVCVGASACAARTPTTVATAPVPAAVAPLVDHAPPVSDPVAEAIAAAESAFEAGRAASDQGHLRDARLAFDLALDTLFAMPGGARTDDRLSAAVDALVDRIAAIELATLSRGDGFTETTEPEPASIDALLSLPAAEADAAPAPEVATTVRADLAATAHDIPIPQNDRVLRFVELFQGNLRGFLTEGMTRGAAYLPMIHTVFRQEGLPLDLSYVPLVESAFKTSALSRASARGVWQFMRGTGKENGLTHDWYVDERADPEKATRAAARYLKTLYTMFGDWHLALASYNGGPGRVQRAIKRSGISDFWALTASSRYLPRETRDYVPMILAAAIIAKNPAQYGFDRPAAPPFTSDVLTVARPVDLRRVAEWAGVPADDIRALNPELRRWTTPIRAREYQLRVPLGTLHSVLDGYAAAGPDDTAVLQWYTVKKGESLPTIARRLRVARNDLAEANYLSARARLVPGQRLVVPRAPSPALLASRGAQGADRAADDTGAEVPARTIYRVRKGDTLYAIARRHGVSVENLRAWNGLKGSALAIGARLEIHAPRQSTAQ